MTELFGRLSGPPEDEPEENRFEPNGRAARWLRRRLAGGVVAVTTTADRVFRATTVSACVIVSTEPLQFLLSLEKQSQMAGWLRESQLLALNILPWQEQLLADQFAGFTPLASPTFRGIEHFTGTTGAPILTNSIAWADCRIVQEFQTGDHVCFIAEALELGRGEAGSDDPLIYYLNRYRQLA